MISDVTIAAVFPASYMMKDCSMHMSYELIPGSRILGKRDHGRVSKQTSGRI